MSFICPIGITPYQASQRPLETVLEVPKVVFN
jgi:hypothetical protein